MSNEFWFERIIEAEKSLIWENENNKKNIDPKMFIDIVGTNKYGLEMIYKDNKLEEDFQSSEKEFDLEKAKIEKEYLAIVDKLEKKFLIDEIKRILSDKVEFAKFRLDTTFESFQILGIASSKDEKGNVTLYINLMSDFACALEQGLPIRADHQVGEEALRSEDSIIGAIVKSTRIPEKVYDAMMKFYKSSMDEYKWKTWQHPGRLRSILQNEYRLNAALRNGN